MKISRPVKSKKEIKNIRTACKITIKIFNQIKKGVKPGITEKEVAALIDRSRKQKKLKKAFKTIIGSGPNGAHPHAVLTDRAIKNGDTVVIDFGIVYKKYRSDLTRTLIIGKISPLMRRIYKTVEEAQKMGIRNIKPGLAIREYVKEVHDYMRSKGYGKYIRHTLGHGIGIKIHEAPKLGERNKRRLKENMVVTIEPGLYVDGVGGVRIEDTVLIKRNGCEVLTK